MPILHAGPNRFLMRGFFAFNPGRRKNAVPGGLPAGVRETPRTGHRIILTDSLSPAHSTCVEHETGSAFQVVLTDSLSRAHFNIFEPIISTFSSSKQLKVPIFFDFFGKAS